QSSVLCFMGHLLMENRNGLIVDAELTRASGTAEREAALAMLGRRTKRHRITLGADKAYDVAAFVGELRRRRVTPHIARDDHLTKTGKRRRSAVDGRTTRHPGYAVSQRLRKRIEEAFGWIKTTGGLRKTRHRGLARVGWMFTLRVAAYNLVRLPKLLAAT
ncbi:transposase, partial [Tistlia consotensis]